MADPRVSQNAVEVVKQDGEPSVTQNAVEVVKQEDGSARVSQNAVEILENHLSVIRTSQSALEAVNHHTPPAVFATQNVIEIIGKGLFEQEFVNVCIMT